jgi:hypothetical protein
VDGAVTELKFYLADVEVVAPLVVIGQHWRQANAIIWLSKSFGMEGGF